MAEHTDDFKGINLTVSTEDVEAAFKETDEQYNEMGYSPWHHIVIDGERKPVKDVFGNIDAVQEEGISKSDFSTLEAEDFLRNVEVEFYNKREHAAEIFQDTLLEIGQNFRDAKTQEFGKDNRMFHLVQEKAPNMAKHLLKRNNIRDLEFQGSAGRGRWTDVPWIAVLHPEETETTQKGVYVVYLIEPETDTIYLTLNQGVQSLLDEYSDPEAREKLVERAKKIRQKIDVPGFTAESIDLETDNIGRFYGPGTIFYKEYSLTDFPSPDILEDDLVGLVEKYVEYLETEEGIDRITRIAKQFEEGYDPEREQRAMRYIEEFQSKFPEDSILDWDINQWAPPQPEGEREDAVYYNMEYDNGGFGGFHLGPSGKRFYLVWYEENGELAVDYDDDVESTFEQMKENIVRAIELIDEGRYSEVKELEPAPHEKVLLRLVSLYRPEKIVPLYSKDKMEETLEVLDLESSGRYFELNKRLLDFKESRSYLEDWSTVKYQDFLWDMLNGELPDPGSSQEGDAEHVSDDKGVYELVSAAPEIHVPSSVVESNLHFPGEQSAQIANQIEAALNAGKHIIFTGPPGTGKTEIARKVADLLVEAEDSPVSDKQMTTATSDWSTFDTVGGYMPGEDNPETLEFNPGYVLRRLPTAEHEHRNELLIIDEINRADIDKAFGQLFTVLSGQKVTLPFQEDDAGERREVSITPFKEVDPGKTPRPGEYYVPKSWRILATMNTYDKTSLYEMSYAFMRRFAFIQVPAPDMTSLESGAEEEVLDRESVVEFVAGYAAADVWDIDVRDRTLYAVGEVWYNANTAVTGRKLGPAIVKDVLTHIAERMKSGGSLDESLTEAIVTYILPQLEGVRDNDAIVQKILDSDKIESNRLKEAARDLLQVEIDG